MKVPMEQLKKSSKSFQKILEKELAQLESNPKGDVISRLEELQRRVLAFLTL